MNYDFAFRLPPPKETCLTDVVLQGAVLAGVVLPEIVVCHTCGAR